MLLFFIPSTVGIVSYGSLVASSCLRLGIVIIGSTVVMLCTGYAAQLLTRRYERQEGKEA